MLGKLPHPGRFHQHIIPVGAIEAMSDPKIDPSPNLNRYLMRTVDIDLCQNQKMILVYSKLPRFVILGFIVNERPNEWRGTQVRLKQGRIEPQRYGVPFNFIEYLNRKARQQKEIASSISQRQREKSDQSFRENVERFAGSDAFVAMQHDVEMFGDAALFQHQSESDIKS